ncbi:MAG: hypothetical protein IBX66_08835 [Lutibacter sp.]|nr:hypothetical protein [Lutibacter sp.]
MKHYFAIFPAILFTSSMIFPKNTAEKKSANASNVLLLKKEFVIPKLNDISHKVWIYLPPNYNNTSKKYPLRLSSI